MKKLKILIIVIIVIIIILTITLVMFGCKERQEKEEQGELITNEMVEEAREERLNIQNNDRFFTIENIVSNYYLYAKAENKNAMLNILTNNFKTNNEITIDNVTNKINIEENEYRAREIIMINNSVEKVIAYLVYGVVGEKNQISDSYFIIYLDTDNSTYAVEPITSENYEQYKSKEMQMNLIKDIEKKEYNTYKSLTISEEDIITEYFENLVKDMLYDTQYAYIKLDQEYKNAKFPSFQDYQTYINNRSEELKSFIPEEMKIPEDFQTEEEYMNYLYNYESKGVDKYKIDKKSDYTQYTIMDDYGNYYIMRVSYPMNYIVILDTYTIDLPEFVEQYNSSAEDKKVQFNIQKFFDAINDGDYSYAYSKLDQTYKNNNFPTQTDFENYMKTNFYAQNKLGYTSYEKNGDLYIYKMVITNGENSSQTIEKQFVVKLLDGTNFVMSFEK